MDGFSFLIGAVVVGTVLLVPIALFLTRFYFANSNSGGSGGSAAVVSIESILLRHVCAATAVLPLAVGVAWMGAYSAAQMADAVIDLGASGQLPGSLGRLAARVGRIDVDVSFLDVEVVACLLFAAYGLVQVQRRLVDIARLLKLSLRRAARPDPALEAQLEAVQKIQRDQAVKRAATAGGGGGALGPAGRR